MCIHLEGNVSSFLDLLTVEKHFNSGSQDVMRAFKVEPVCCISHSPADDDSLAGGVRHERECDARRRGGGWS